jgi:S1-C subfamily serine protease
MTINLRAWHLVLLSFVAGLAVAASVLLIARGSGTNSGDESSAEKVGTQASLPAPTGASPTPSIKATLTNATPTSTPTTCSSPAAAAMVRPSVVRLQTTSALGTGFIVETDGLILTNAHVVEGARVVSVTLHDKRVLSGTVGARDENKDLAVVRVNAGTLSPIKWGQQRDLVPGSRLLAWGYAADLPGEPSLTSGSFSGTRVEGPVTYIQTDTPLTFGNSGGPLFNECGEIVGVVTSGLRVQGFNFAVSTGDAQGFLDQVQRSPAPVTEQLSTIETTALFYSLLDQRAFEQAYGLLSRKFRGEGTLEGFVKGYETMRGALVERVAALPGATAQVRISVLANDLLDGKTVIRRFSGTWSLVREGGAWKLDEGVIGVELIRILP